MILPDLSEEEAALWAILSDESGIELAEAFFTEPGHESETYRLRDYQWELNSSPDPFQATRGARNTGKSYGMQMRACVHPFARPGADYLLTAPQMNHLQPLTTAIEERVKGTWLVAQMLPVSAKSDGFKRAPHWECSFVNGAKLVSRLPGAGPFFRGVKGQHVDKIDVDEVQDYPDEAMRQLRECLNTVEGAQMRISGVPTGVRGFYYNVTEGIDIGWTVHRPIAMNRPNWDDTERREKIAFYEGRETQGYRANLYGDHGDSAVALFVLSRLVKNIDLAFDSRFNTEVYNFQKLDFDVIGDTPAGGLWQPNGLWKSTWDDAPKGYSGFHAGMDVGATNDPSEILIFGQRAGVQKEQLDLLNRIQLKQIPIEQQEALVEALLAWFGPTLTTFGIDATGLGFDMAQRLSTRHPGRCWGVNFSEKKVVGLQDRELEPGEDPENLEIKRNVIDQASDWLREIVDSYGFLLPNDNTLISDWQGQTVVTTKVTSTDPYGKRSYAGGKSHSLDAAKVMIAAKRLVPLEAILNAPVVQESVLDLFLG